MGLRDKSENRYFNAISNVPRSARMMYVHAYLSYLWNFVVSKRFNRYGNKICKSLYSH